MEENKPKPEEITKVDKFLLEKRELDEGLEVAKSPKQIADLQQNLFMNTGFTTKDYLGIIGEGKEQRAGWKKESLTALVPTDLLHSLDQTKKRKVTAQGYLLPTPPKITVSQVKNLDTLMFMLEKANRKASVRGQEKSADLEFTLKQYAKIRGYTDLEVEKSGNFIYELKRDLISGGVTSYIIDREKLDGKKSVLIGSFYTIEVPKVKSKERWKIYFNEPYRSYILKVKQYYPILLKAIGDKRTDHNKGYLYLFLKKVLAVSNNADTKFKTQLKVSTLLEAIKVGEKTKSRPQEAYKVLAECITYLADSFPTVLKEVRLLNSEYKTRVIEDLSLFKTMDYKAFSNEILVSIGIEDIRDCLISFNAIGLKEEEEISESPLHSGFYLDL